MYVFQKNLINHRKKLFALVILKEIHALMFKVLKSIYIIASTNRFIYAHIRTDL